MILRSLFYASAFIAFYGSSAIATEQRPFGVGIGYLDQALEPINKHTVEAPLDHTARVNTISVLEAEIGPYHPTLSEALLEAAEQALRAGWLDEASSLFSQALHNKRINEGLYSEGQLQIVQKLATIFRIQGDRAGLRDRADYYYRILGAGKPPLTEQKLVAADQWLDVRTELLVSSGWQESERDIIELYEHAEDLLSAACSADTPDRQQTGDGCKAISLRFLALGYLIDWHVEPLIQNEFGTRYSGQARYSREWDRHPSTQRMETIERGIDLTMRRVIDQALVMMPEDPELRLARADWHWFNGRNTRALIEYQALYGDFPDWFTAPHPLPQHPRLSADPRLAEDVDTVFVSCRIGTSGRASDVTVVNEESVEAVQGAVARVKRRLREIKFRPAFDEGGEPVEALFAKELALLR